LNKKELLKLLEDDEIQEAILAIKKPKKKKEHNLEDILKEKDKEIEMLKGFLACGVQEKNISSLWDYVKDELREEKNSDIKSLKTIFNFFFEGYNRAYPMYEVQKVKVGDVFDTEEYIKTNTSSVSGKVDEVVFSGWVNAKTQKIVKKSIVKVK